MTAVGTPVRTATEVDQGTRPARGRRGRRIWQHRALYGMLLIPVAWFVVFRYGPMAGLIISFKDYNIGLGLFGSPWADPWYKYFQQFFTSPYFGQLMSNTLLISLYKLVWGTVPSIIVALLLNECRRRWLGKWVQTLSYMPHFLSWVVVFGIALAFLSPSGGLLNRALGEVGADPIAFMTSSEWFRTVLVAADTWKDLGWGAIIYLAAMMGVDQSLYEAARVDGASRLRQMWHITLAGIRPVIVIMFVLKLGHLMDAGFDQVYIFYSVPVYPVGDIIDTWVFRTGLERLNFPLASAVGVFKSVIGFALVLGANRLARRWGGQLW